MKKKLGGERLKLTPAQYKALVKVASVARRAYNLPSSQYKSKFPILYKATYDHGSEHMVYHAVWDVMSGNLGSPFVVPFLKS